MDSMSLPVFQSFNVFLLSPVYLPNTLQLIRILLLVGEQKANTRALGRTVHGSAIHIKAHAEPTATPMMAHAEPTATPTTPADSHLLPLCPWIQSLLLPTAPGYPPTEVSVTQNV